jgi:hypothetical protein
MPGHHASGTEEGPQMLCEILREGRHHCIGPSARGREGVSGKTPQIQIARKLPHVCLCWHALTCRVRREVETREEQRQSHQRAQDNEPSTLEKSKEFQNIARVTILYACINAANNIIGRPNSIPLILIEQTAELVRSSSR